MRDGACGSRDWRGAGVGESEGRNRGGGDVEAGMRGARASWKARVEVLRCWGSVLKEGLGWGFTGLCGRQELRTGTRGQVVQCPLLNGGRPGRRVQYHRQGPPYVGPRMRTRKFPPRPVPAADAAAGIWRRWQGWAGRCCQAPSSSSCLSCCWRSRCTALLRGRPPPPRRTVSTVRTVGHRAARSGA